MRLRLRRWRRSTAAEPASTEGTKTVPAPDFDSINAYVNRADEPVQYQMSEVVEAFAAEAAAQRSVCKVPAVDAEWPEDLAEALRRRVQHNLALRALPLAVQGAVDGGVPVRVGGSDSEVRRLEAPYRRRTVA